MPHNQVSGVCATPHHFSASYTAEELRVIEDNYWAAAKLDPALSLDMRKAGWEGQDVPTREEAERILGVVMWGPGYAKAHSMALMEYRCPDIILYTDNFRVQPPNENGERRISCRYWLIPEMTVTRTEAKDFAIPHLPKVEDITRQILDRDFTTFLSKYAVEIPSSDPAQPGDVVTLELFEQKFQHRMTVADDENLNAPRPHNPLSVQLRGITLGTHTLKLNGKDTAVAVHGIHQRVLPPWDDKLIAEYGAANQVVLSSIDDLYDYATARANESASERIRDSLGRNLTLQILAGCEYTPIPVEWMDYMVELSRPGTMFPPGTTEAQILDYLSGEAVKKILQYMGLIAVGRKRVIPVGLGDDAHTYAAKVLDILVEEMVAFRPAMFGNLAEKKSLGQPSHHGVCNPGLR